MTDYSFGVLGAVSGVATSVVGAVGSVAGGVYTSVIRKYVAS